MTQTPTWRRVSSLGIAQTPSYSVRDAIKSIQLVRGTRGVGPSTYSRAYAYPLCPQSLPEREGSGLHRPDCRVVREQRIPAKLLIVTLARLPVISANDPTIAGLRGYPKQSVYNILTCAQAHLTRCLNIECGHEDIRVKRVCPTYAKTGLTRELFDGNIRMRSLLSAFH